jgi:hypothetical protein
MKGILRQLVGIFEAFHAQFRESATIDRCLMCIRVWLQNDDPEIDLVQEIDFLLSLCLSVRQYDSGALCKRSLDRFQVMSHFDCEMVKEIRELKQIVSDVKSQIRASDNQRKAFISQKLQR